jgi:alkanesulfonate monooxygenase SsuD/methylene tetrahydromethanopterin reductase-like flavin-dependent oxidoreductase (luciferase family)
MAALSAATERVGLGTLVACTAFHPPGLVAKMAATICEVSEGRLVLGLGAGWNEVEFRAFGLPFDHRVSRFEECFTIVRKLLAGERASLAGRFVQAEDAVLLPAPTYRVPLMIGSTGPRMLGIALPHVDAWNSWYEGFGNTPRGFSELNERISAAARDAGRQPAEIERSACVLVQLGPDPAERPHLPEAPALTGAPDRIAASLREFGDAGADELILIADPITERSVRTLAEVVAAV